ncbi:magnesium/cobalt transporter CorA [soil metagenome]
MGSVIIDCAAYRDGIRSDTSPQAASLNDALASLDDDHDFIWIGMHDPTLSELQQIAEPLKLHPLAVEDAIEAHQRTKVERYSDHLFLSIRTVTYNADAVETAEVSMFLGEKYLLTVRHGNGHDLKRVRARAEKNADLLGHGATAAMHAILDSIVDEYEKVAAELEIDVQEVEQSVFSITRTNDASRIYALKRETLEFRRAVLPLKEPMIRFSQGVVAEEARPFFRDIADHLVRVAEAIESIEKLLENALQAHLAQLSVQQNEDMRKLTAGATLFAVPTAIAGIYGMNFEHMPELTWQYGYPLALVVIASLCAYIYWRFKRSGWL